MRKYVFTILILLSLIMSIESNGQTDNLKLDKVDSLFTEWNSPNHPGGTIGIMQDGKLIFCRSYGLASLEFLVPNSNSTRYNIASISKQFTAFGILLLEKEGKLSVSDDIHLYLKELPDFGREITIEHMIHHTSGLRSLHSMLQLAGWRDDDLRTNDDLMRFMVRQKDLNFDPGDQYMYCNTGYIMMSEIIERLTGEDFAQWMSENVFIPLGMYNTYVEDKYNRVVTENATSYMGSDKRGFEREIDYWGYVGSGNIHSTAEDILIWQKNFYAPVDRYRPIFKKMETREILNSGDTIPYAFGVNVDMYKGNKRISHGGSIGGYRSTSATFPGDRLSVVVLTNFSSSSTSAMGNRVADIMLNSIENESSGSERLIDKGSKPEPYAPTERELLSIIGEYWSPELLTTYFISYKDNQLKVYHTRHGYFDLKGTEKDVFEGSASFFRTMKVIRDRKGSVTGVRVSNSRVLDLWFKKR